MFMEKSLEGFKQRSDSMMFSFHKNRGLQCEEYLSGMGEEACTYEALH